VLALKVFEIEIPEEYIRYIHKEIKNPKRPNTESFELWLERELGIENEGTYGNLTIDESHVTVQLLPNGNYKVIISEVCFSMIVSHVQPEPYSHKMGNDDVFHFWLDIRTDKLHLQEHIKVREVSDR
jgi:hypothetical protein